MLVIEAVLIIGYFWAQTLEVSAQALPVIGGYLTVLFAVPMLVITITAYIASQKWSVLRSQNRTALIIGHLFLYGAIFVSYGKLETFYADMGSTIFDKTFNISFLNTSIVFIIALLGAFFIPAVMAAPYMKKYFSKKYLLCLVLISAYSSYAIFGDSLFFQHEFSRITLMVSLMGVVWIFPIMLEVLATYEILTYRLQRTVPSKTRTNRFVWLTSFAVFLTIWLLYLIGCNPAQMSGDSINMWRHATSGEKIGYFAFPTIDILMVRLLTYMIPHPMFIALIQVIVFAVVCSFFMLQFYKWGIPLRVIYPFAVIFAMLPSNGLMIVTLWSSTPYLLSMLFLTYALLRLFSPDAGKVLPYINLAIALALTYSTRHEGMIPAIICITFLLCKIIKKRTDMKLLAAAVAGCALIALIQGPLYKAIRIEKDIEGMITHSSVWMTLLDGIQGVIYYGGNLPTETQEFMESIMTLNEWKEGYSIYDINYSVYNDNLNNISQQEGFTRKVFTYYLDTFRNEPLLLIKNRLANSNLVWGITQPKGTYNERPMTWTNSDRVGFERHENVLTFLLTRVFFVPSVAFAPFDILLYRSGVYIVLSLLLCVYLLSNKSFRIAYLFLPIAGGMLSVFIAMDWPLFRAIWFVPAICTLVFPLILAQVAHSTIEIM